VKPKSGRPDFQAALASFTATPGKDKYDELLPPDYVQKIPEVARKAFEAVRFTLGEIPQWIPPVQYR